MVKCISLKIYVKIFCTVPHTTVSRNHYEHHVTQLSALAIQDGDVNYTVYNDVVVNVIPCIGGIDYSPL